MPSSDKTFYNIKRLHWLFAVSSLALLGVTAWMVIADHRRQWKVYQRTFLDEVEPWLTESQIRDRRTDAFTREEELLASALAQAQESAPSRETIDRFLAEWRRFGSKVDPEPINEAYKALADSPSAEARRTLVERLDEAIDTASLPRQRLDRRLQFLKAEFDEARSRYEAAVGQGLAAGELTRLQRRVETIKENLAEVSQQVEQASLHYDTLLAIRLEITSPQDSARRALAEHRRDLERLDRNLAAQRPNWGKRLLRLPFLEAFGRPLSIRQIWLPELTIDFNFRDVARFDRCMTCHLGVDKVVPGTDADPACLPLETLVVQLATPEEPPNPADGLEAVYGFSLAPRGILDLQAPTVGLVLPRTPAARAGIRAGDVILQINEVPVVDSDSVTRRLTAGAPWGEPLTLQVRRGLPQPFSAHPRLDLFVGSRSPHPVQEYGCTICHDGQGSATSFKFASHTPNHPRQRRRWQDEYDWFWNKHWLFPMLPKRFAESRCLKCHHDVTDLEPSDRFLDPPAGTVVSGYHLVRQNGCFGCHEIRGVTNSGERIGPDMRLEPNYCEAALELLLDPGLKDEEKTLARAVALNPADTEARQKLVASLRDSGADDTVDQPRQLRPKSDRMMTKLATETAFPGTLTKVGPSLRDAASRLTPNLLDAWTKDPGALRPATRMPAFYGMHEHLDGPSLDDSKRFEAVEIHSISEYLLAASQPVPLGPPPPEVTEDASAERGRRLFQLRGCLACHMHADFPEALSEFGPDLSNLGSKFTTEKARQWLVDWIRDPTRHRSRTRMPDARLDPLPLDEGTQDESAERESESGQATDGEEAGERKFTDPAADIAEYLLDSDEWEIPNRTPLIERDLDELALLYLSERLPKSVARQYLQQGIPQSARDTVQGDAIELLGEMTLAKKVRYVGRCTVRKRGCFGCHDIPGFEDAQPIGPALSDWGRKQESLLAFEQVHRFVESIDDKGEDLTGKDSDRAFYREALVMHRREGFIWQKLRAPRSFDYKKTENKGYNERLTMGRFSFNDEEREAIITFILGLVSDPPANQYVYHPDRRRRAIVEGRKVLDKYGCAECHILEMERWQFEYDPEQFEEPIPIEDYDFVRPKFSQQELAQSAETDRRGLGHAEVVGRPRLDPMGEVLEDVDDDDNPLYFFSLWEPAAINGEVWTIVGGEVPISEPQITRRRPAWGGRLARLLFPVVLQGAWDSGSTAADLEAWGWVPPPLVAEGRRVEPEWLYEYLANPYAIRPAAVLRMPKYNFSAEETARLVDFFAAASNADFPYTSVRYQTDFLESGIAERRDEAMRLVTDRKTYCAKCHLIGDYTPGDQVRTTLAPDLERVGRRLRPSALRQWLANPKSVLPYTGMPVNFPPQGPLMGQDLFEGTSLEQLDAVTDLLLHYEDYLKKRTSMSELILSGETPERAASAAPQ